jgi:hypothetical protein
MEEFSMKANLDRLRVSEALEYSNKVNEDRGRCVTLQAFFCAPKSLVFHFF